MSDILNELTILRNIKGAKRLKGEDKIANEVSIYLKALTLENRLKGVWFHVPNESVVRDTKDIIRINTKHNIGMINGAPDFVIASPNKTIFIELKTEKGRQTESQKSFEKWCHKHGISYDICRNVTDIENVLNREEVIS